MNDLHKALGDIHSIRRQMARNTEFRGYGPATLAATAVAAALAASLQALWIPDPVAQLSKYLALWIATAVISAGLTATQMHARTRRMHSALSDEMLRTAIEQFLPAVGSAALVTVVIVRTVPAIAWIIPGLWQVMFSLGIFASSRFLPRPILAVGIWYLLAGLFSISLGDARALSPWTMGVAYGVGQLMAAAILFLTRREVDDES